MDEMSSTEGSSTMTEKRTKMSKWAISGLVTMALIVTTIMYTLSFTPGALPLSQAIFQGNVERVEELLDQGTSANSPMSLSSLINIMEKPPLCWAAMAGQLEIVKLLLERGAKLESKDPNGFTPLVMAVCVPGNSRIIQFLIDQGADSQSYKYFQTVAHPSNVNVLVQNGVLAVQAPIAKTASSQ
jgi:ankyrin repeat protein